MSSFAPGAPPSVDALFAEWWGGPPADPFFQFDTGAASNLTFGGNPLYQIADFLAFYPKFGSYVQAISVATVAAGGTGYAVNDTLSPVQTDASGAVVTVATIGAGGAITGVAVAQGGTGYSLGTALPTTTLTGVGTGATLNITNITPAALLIPQAAIQLFINLASASLQASRWLDTWKFGMALYVAHFCTLYLQSEGNPGTTPGRVAVSGLAKGIAVSKAAGDVSVSYDSLLGELEGWGAFTLTTYGQQLVTFARSIGMGPMYIYG